MMSIVVAAFIMGLLGSFHCVGMCGPIAMSLPISTRNAWDRVSGAFVYNAGRVTTYSVFGLIFGVIGQSFFFFGFQQGLSIILGSLVILFVLLPKRYLSFTNANALARWLGRLRSELGKLLGNKSHSSLYLIGLLNGLLPCGLVYMAAAAAVATGHIRSSVLFMAFFGLGTLPMMWAIGLFGGFVGIELRRRVKQAYPYVMLLVGTLLIIRGLGLGIADLSPKVDMARRIVMSCFPKTQ